MRILVTGASGLLGINLALEAAKTHQVFGQVNQHNIHIPDQIKNFQVIQADLLVPGALEKVLDQVQPDWIIHSAALAIIDACEADPILAQKLNTDIPARLAQLTKIGKPDRKMGNVARGGARLLHISTDAVFDGKKPLYYEDDTPNPLSVYAQTKLAGENAVREENPEALIARVNLIGWSISSKRSLAEFFYYNLKAGRQVMGFTDVYFCPMLANHLAILLITMLEKNLQGLYHLVSRDCITKYEYGVRLARRFGLDESLIIPQTYSSVDSDNSRFLKATRSQKLCLATEKISHDLDTSMPGIDESIEGLFRLHQEGYPEMLNKLAEPLIITS